MKRVSKDPPISRCRIRQTACVQPAIKSLPKNTVRARRTTFGLGVAILLCDAQRDRTALTCCESIGPNQILTLQMSWFAGSCPSGHLSKIKNKGQRPTSMIAVPHQKKSWLSSERLFTRGCFFLLLDGLTVATGLPVPYGSREGAAWHNHATQRRLMQRGVNPVSAGFINCG